MQSNVLVALLLPRSWDHGAERGKQHREVDAHPTDLNILSNSGALTAWENLESAVGCTALAQGASPQERGFEPHTQEFGAIVLVADEPPAGWARA